MAFTYTSDANSTVITTGTKYTSSRGIDTYAYTRGFLRYDLSSYGWSVSDITAVELRIYVTLTSGSPTIRLRSAISTDSNWGTVLTVPSRAVNFNSTSANIEATQGVTATGWNTFTVDKNNLDLSGTTWFRLASTQETTTTTKTINFSSENSTTNKPVLRVTTVDAGGYTHVVYVMAS